MDTQAEIEALRPKRRFPFPGTALIGAVAGIAIGAGGATLLHEPDAKKKRGETPAASAAPSASASASAAPSAAPPEPPPLTLTERAALGDEGAVKELEGKPLESRSIVETVALSKARAAARRKDLVELTRKIGLVPAVAQDQESAARIKDFAGDREVATDLLQAFAGLPGPTGPDLVYKLLTSAKKGSETERIAEELSYGKELRSKASPALSVLLDLRKLGEDCDAAVKILEKVKEVGDKRVFPQMSRFYKKTGCGDTKTKDCWACLRKPDILKDVVKEVAKRPAP